MARYMLQASYTAEGIAALVNNPHNRAEAVRPLLEGAGGKLISFDYAFGDYDVVAMIEAPDNVSAAALVMAVIAGGAVKEIKTTVLIPPEEAVAAMRLAASTAYAPPGA